MASIHPHHTKAGKRYRVRWRDPDGNARSRVVPDLSTAKILRGQVERCAALGERWEPAGTRRSPDLESVAVAYLTSRAARLQPTTLKRYETALVVLVEQVAPRFAGRRVPLLSDLSIGMLEAGYRHLTTTGRHGHHRKATTASGHVSVWHLMWEWAAARPEFREHCPEPVRMELPRLPKPRPVAPTWEQFDGMLTELATGNKSRARARIWRLAMLTRYLCLRRTAARRLRWDHLDLKSGRALIPDEITKGFSSGRDLPIHPAFLAELKTWPQATRTVAGFPDQAEEDRGWHIGRVCSRAWRRSEAPPFTYTRRPLHCVRKTWQTHLVGSRVHPDVADLIMGHTSGRTGPRHYLHAGGLWPDLVEAIATVPPYTGARPSQE